VLSILKTISIFGIFLSLVTSGCAPADRRLKPFSAPALNTKVTTPRALIDINSVLLLPVRFDVNTRHLAGSEIAGSLYKNLETVALNQLDIEVISGKEVPLAGEMPERLTPALLREYASISHADSLLLTQLHSYYDKVGTQFSASQPALVDFSMALFHVESESYVWRATYHFRDQALSENLFRLQENLYAKRGPRWMNALEIWRHGLELALRDLALERTRAFEELPR